MKYLAFLFCACTWAQPVLVTVTGAINNPDNSGWTGTLTISNPRAHCSGVAVPPASRAYRVAAGVISPAISLYPLLDCTPSSVYTVTYSGSARGTAYWRIHSSPTTAIITNIESRFPGTLSEGEIGGPEIIAIPGLKCDGASDNTAAVVAVTSVAPAGSVVQFPRQGTCIVGSLGVIPNPITLDLGGSTVQVKANGDWLTTAMVAAGINHVDNPYIIRNGIITAFPGYTPTNVIVVASGQPDTRIDGVTFTRLTASHAIVWNRAGYGTAITHSPFKWNTAPSIVYWSNNLGDYDQYTLAGQIEHSDFSNNVGQCVTIEGGTLSIDHGVIEGCSGGGVEHTGVSNLYSISINDIHFESNSLFNVRLPLKGTNNTWSKASITKSAFYVNPSGQTLLLGEDTRLSFKDNYVSAACIYNRDQSGYPNVGSMDASGNTVDGGLPACNTSYGYLVANEMGTPPGKVESAQQSSQRGDNSGITSRIINNANPAGSERIYLSEDGDNYAFITRYNTLGANSGPATWRNAMVFQTNAQLPCTTTGCGDIVFRPFSGLNRFAGLLVMESDPTAQCTSATAGAIDYVAGTTGVPDIARMCLADGAGGYAWGNVASLPPSILHFQLYGQPQSTTNYLPPSASGSSAEARVAMPIAASMTATSLNCSVTPTPASGQNITFTVRSGLTPANVASCTTACDSAMTCSIANGATACGDNSHPVTLSPGTLTNPNMWDLRAVTSATSGTLYWVCSMALR